MRRPSPTPMTTANRTPVDRARLNVHSISDQVVFHNIVSFLVISHLHADHVFRIEMLCVAHDT